MKEGEGPQKEKSVKEHLMELFQQVRDAPPDEKGYYLHQINKISEEIKQKNPHILQDSNALESSTGMMASHIDEIRGFSAMNDTIVGFRPVNDSVRELFEEGKVGKGMDIKGKSADQGIALQGLIPRDAAFSKLGTKDDFESIDKYNHINEEKYDQDRKRYQNIVNTQDVSSLTQKDFDHLTETIPLTDKVSGKPVFGFKDQEGYALKDAENQMIFAVQEGSAEKGFTYHREGSGEKLELPQGAVPSLIEVFAYRNIEVSAEGKLVEHESAPITADYDQLVVGTKMENKGAVYALSDNKYAGFATDAGHTITTVLTEDTRDRRAVSHGQETGNPCPEDIFLLTTCSLYRNPVVMPELKYYIMNRRSLIFTILKRKKDISCL